MRRDLFRHLETFDGMRLLVTHDRSTHTRLRIASRILDGGQIVQTGTLAEVSGTPSHAMAIWSA